MLWNDLPTSSEACDGDFVIPPPRTALVADPKAHIGRGQQLFNRLPPEMDAVEIAYAGIARQAELIAAGQ